MDFLWTWSAQGIALHSKVTFPEFQLCPLCKQAHNSGSTLLLSYDAFFLLNKEFPWNNDYF